MRPHHYGKRIRVQRSGYHRKGYTRKAFTEHRDGHIIHEPRTHVEATHVPATTFYEKDRGLKGRGPQTLPPIEHRGELTSHGYHIHELEEKRHEALKRVREHHSKQSILGMLGWQINVREHTQPKARKIFKEDYQWASRNLI